MAPELIPVLGSQPAGDRSQIKPGLSFILSVRPTVTYPAAEHHRPLADTKLYCLVTGAHVCKQLTQGCTRQRGGRDSILRPVDRKSGFLTTRPRSHTSIVLYCIVLCCVVLCYVMLCYVILYYIILYYIILHYITLHYITLY